MPFLEKLKGILSTSQYTGGNQFRFPDASILRFIRQFSLVETEPFNALALPKFQQWLAHGLQNS